MIALVIVLLHLIVIALVAGYLLGIRSGYNSGFDAGHTAGWTAAGGPELPPLGQVAEDLTFEEEVEQLLRSPRPV